MGQLRWVTVAALLCFLSSVDGGKVLVFPVDGSHWLNMKVLIEELHSRGHNITVIRPKDSRYIEAKSPHYVSIEQNIVGGLGGKDDFISFAKRILPIRLELTSTVSAAIGLVREHVEYFYHFHKAVVETMGDMFEDTELMQSFQDAKFDVVLTDPFTGGGALLARRLDLPLVFNARWTIQGEGHQVVAPSPLSYVPMPGLKVTDKMTFTERLKNMFLHLSKRLLFMYITEPNYKPFVRRYFGPDVHYMELFQAADIWLMRNDFTFEFPRPTMPNIVYMGGFQCKPSEPLPRDLEDFVQSSGDHGVIIMTMGTLVGSLPEDLAEYIAAAFAQLPQKVIWRHTGKRPSTLGNNTLLLDWLPQNDLLGHPKTRVFVTHGGTNGVQEAIYHGVPLVGLHLMFDQEANLFRMKARDVARVLDIATVNRDMFLEALRAVLHEPSYRENMQRLSRLHRDQPMRPLDRAMFWIEFVMRHKGAPHLRTESYKMSWIQYHSVDVVAFLLAVVFLITFICCLIITFLWHNILCWRKVKHD